MQRILVYLVVLIISTTVEAQDLYYVTLVRGIVKKADGSVLKTGDQLPANAKLNFSDNTCRLLLLHPQKGRFIVEPKQTKSAIRGEMMIFLQDHLQFLTQSFQLSSRGEGENLDQYFSTRTSDSIHLLFIGETRFDLHNSGYETTDSANQFFFLQYVTVNGQAINHKLSSVNDTLLIPEASFQLNGILPGGDQTWKLGYVKNYSRRDIVQIASFKPVFITEEVCKSFLKIIRQKMGNDRNKIMEEAYQELIVLYGKPSVENLYFLIDHL